MGENKKIQELIYKILYSKTIDEKRRIGKQVVELFKNTNYDISIVIQLNLSLKLRDVIDNFIIQDNLTSRETLQNFLSRSNLCLEEAQQKKAS